VCGLAIAQWLGGASGQEASGSTLYSTMDHLTESDMALSFMHIHTQKVERQLRSWGESIGLITQPVEGATRTCCSLLHHKPAKPQQEQEAWVSEYMHAHYREMRRLF